MNFKTGITKENNKYSVWFKIEGYTFHLEHRTEYENAEWIEEQLQNALSKLGGKNENINR